ncbi:MAG: hypothetical protein JJ855_09675 [Rhodospirillales bacterium]|nr:hypothetical protein [Rhodospirillales bacterium]
MKRAFRIIAQGVVYCAFAVLVGYFSAAPAYRLLDDGEAQIKLSFAYGGKPVGGCRDRSAAELEALAPNMRKAQVCSRERVPLAIEFELDDKMIYKNVLPPSGIHGDGPSRMYEKFVIGAGEHKVGLRLRTTVRDQGWDYITRRIVRVDAGDNLAIDFDPVAGGFVISGAKGGG